MISPEGIDWECSQHMLLIKVLEHLVARMREEHPANSDEAIAWYISECIADDFGRDRSAPQVLYAREYLRRAFEMGVV